MRELEDKAKQAMEARAQTQRMVDLLNEKVHTHKLTQYTHTHLQFTHIRTIALHTHTTSKENNSNSLLHMHTQHYVCAHTHILQVKIAEEEAQVHARKNLEAEEEIRRVRASAVKVGSPLQAMAASTLMCHK